MKRTLSFIVLISVFPLGTVMADSGGGQPEQAPGTTMSAGTGATPNAPVPQPARRQWEVGGAIAYQAGDFGTDKTTSTVYIPITLSRIFDKGKISWTLPYIYQKTGPGITALEGRPFRTGRGALGPTHSAEGLGDMILKGNYALLKETDQPFNLAAMAKIKFPTADEDKGLGTGEFDEGIGLQASKSLDDRWSILGGIAHTWIGDPPGTDLNNEFAFDLGGGYQLTDPTLVSVIYEERTALLDGRSNPRDLIFGVRHEINETLRLSGDFSIGLSNGSPDIGIETGVISKF